MNNQTMVTYLLEQYGGRRRLAADGEYFMSGWSGPNNNNVVCCNRCEKQ
jgi:hypothetical protein